MKKQCLQCKHRSEHKRLKTQQRIARKEFEKFIPLYLKLTDLMHKINEQLVGVTVTICGDLQETADKSEKTKGKAKPV